MVEKKPSGLQDEIDALRDLEETKKSLVSENATLRAQIDELTGELEGIAISRSSADAYMNSYAKRLENCDEDLRGLAARRDLLMGEIDDLHLKVKVAKQDEEMSAKLLETLMNELQDIKTQKGIVNKKLDHIQSGIRKISSEKDQRIPQLRQYDSLLKDIHTTLMETQSRMEVSLMLKQK